MNAQELIDFETEIAELFNSGQIPYPVHLTHGNEEQLIDIFKGVGPNDWIFGSWRLHYHALLKGVPKEELKAAIMRGESMALRFENKRVYGSAIVGGIVPIALGVAMSIKQKKINERVWCFIGDMTERTGIARECMAYAGAFDLPITFVVEDNGLSVCSPTEEACGIEKAPDVLRYPYKSKYPHCGAGKRVQF